MSIKMDIILSISCVCKKYDIPISLRLINCYLASYSMGFNLFNNFLYEPPCRLKNLREMLTYLDEFWPYRFNVPVHHLNLVNFLDYLKDTSMINVTYKYDISQDLASLVPRFVSMNNSICNECFVRDHICTIYPYEVLETCAMDILRSYIVQNHNLPSIKLFNTLIEVHYIYDSNREILQNRLSNNKLHQEYIRSNVEYKTFIDNNLEFKQTLALVTDANLIDYIIYCFDRQYIMPHQYSSLGASLTHMPKLKEFLKHIDCEICMTELEVSNPLHVGCPGIICSTCKIKMLDHIQVSPIGTICTICGSHYILKLPNEAMDLYQSLRSYIQYTFLYRARTYIAVLERSIQNQEFQWIMKQFHYLIREVETQLGVTMNKYYCSICKKSHSMIGETLFVECSGYYMCVNCGDMLKSLDVTHLCGNYRICPGCRNRTVYETGCKHVTCICGHQFSLDSLTPRTNLYVMLTSIFNHSRSRYINYFTTLCSTYGNLVTYKDMIVHALLFIAPPDELF